MPKLAPNALPAYRLHRRSGQAVVKIPGQNEIYLGVHGTKASKKEYDRIVGDWVAAGRPVAPSKPKHTDISISEMILAYDDHLTSYYGEKHGRTGGHVGAVRATLKLLRQLYGRTPANDFGPVKLTAVREAMIAKGWGRKSINARVDRLRLMFRWAVSHEMIPVDRWAALKAVEPLREGKSTAKETAPVLPVSEAHLQAAIDHANPVVSAMLKLQRLTGMRPGELCAMTVGTINTAGEVWIYTPPTHKTQHKGHTREIYLGAKAQDIIRPFLSLNPAAPVFSPIHAMEWHRQQRRQHRRTDPRWGNSPGTNAVSKPSKKAGPAYTPASYGQAIDSACDKAFPLPPELAPRQIPKSTGKGTKPEPLKLWKARLTAAGTWDKVRQWRKDHRFHPHMVRHSAATEIRRTHGLEVAQVLLGHRSIQASQIYAETDREKARKVAGEVG